MQLGCDSLSLELLKHTLTKNKKSKLCVTYRACAHNALIALLGWEEVVLSEGLPRLINASIIPAGFHRGSQPCRDPGLIWGGHITQDRGLWSHNHSGFWQKAQSWRGVQGQESLTCASWTTLLRLSYWVFTWQSRALDCVTFHMACLREKQWSLKA